MQWFSVHVITDVSADSVSDNQWDRLAELTALYSASWGNEAGIVSVTLSVQAATLPAAAAQATGAVSQTLEITGFPDIRINAVNTMTETYFRATVNTVTPEFIGIADAASIRGVSAQAMRKAAENGKYGAIRVGRTWAFPTSALVRKAHSGK